MWRGALILRPVLAAGLALLCPNGGALLNNYISKIVIVPGFAADGQLRAGQ